jgi:hypothetical protein
MYDANSRKLSRIRTSAGTFFSAFSVGLVSFALSLLSVSLDGCGVVGDVLPPALNLPARATDMVVLEHGKNIAISYQLPKMTTEGQLIRHQPEIDLRIGPAPEDVNNAAGWASRATRIPTSEPHIDIPVAPWVNQKVAVAVRLLNDHGKDAGWSPLVVATIIPPVDAPKGVEPSSQPSGVHLKWVSSAPKFRVFRHQSNAPGFEQVATPDKPEYDDNVGFGSEYSYYVQALAPAGDRTAESEDSTTVSIKPEDKFPPSAPVGLNFILGGKTIELTWTRNTEPDLAGYRVYRAFENNSFERIREAQESTSYSDRNIEPGKRYRYTVTAVDRSGNESSMSAPVTVTAP